MFCLMSAVCCGLITAERDGYFGERSGFSTCVESRNKVSAKLKNHNMKMTCPASPLRMRSIQVGPREHLTRIFGVCSWRALLLTHQIVEILKLRFNAG